MKIILTWQPPSSDGRSPLTNYEVYRSKTSGTEIFISETGNVLTYTDTSVSLGETYYYKVSAKNKIGEGPLSNEISMTIHSTPSAPLNLKTTVNGTQIKLTWNAPKSTDSTIKNYKIFWGTSSGNYTESITIGNITTYSFIDLSRGVRYYFVVCAINFIGEGPKSNEALAIIEQQKNNELIPYSTFMIIIILVIVIIAVIVSIIIFFKKKRKTVPIVPTPPPDLPTPRQP
jgi:fibronectin type 3 domain-containing protein